MKCIIRVITYKNEYVEEWYGMLETIDRVEELKRCHNVIGIDMMSGETGEILYQLMPSGEVYIDNNSLVELITEEYLENRG